MKVLCCFKECTYKPRILPSSGNSNTDKMRWLVEVTVIRHDHLDANLFRTFIDLINFEQEFQVAPGLFFLWNLGPKMSKTWGDPKHPKLEINISLSRLFLWKSSFDHCPKLMLPTVGFDRDKLLVQWMPKNDPKKIPKKRFFLGIFRPSCTPWFFWKKTSLFGILLGS